MNRVAILLIALAGCLTTASPSQAQYCAPALGRPLAWGPDMSGPGVYLVNCYGQPVGPCYYVYPHYPPEMGVVMPFMIPQQHQKCQLPNSFPTHPYMRSPRDFFMWRENMEEMRGRDVRPFQVP